MIRIEVETHDGVRAELEISSPVWSQDAALAMVVAMDRQMAALKEAHDADRAAARAALRAKVMGA